MEGIEILSIGEIGINYVFNWEAAFSAGFIFGTLVGILIGIESKDVAVALITFLIIGLIAGSIFGMTMEVPTGTVSTYKITIDDTVSLNDFYEKYEVLEQEGKIFTVKERME